VAITWESDSTKSYHISLYNEDELVMVLPQFPSAGSTSCSFALTSEYQIPDGSAYQVKVTDTDGNSDMSDGYFTIQGGSGPPIVDITVTSPNGGETWTRGTEVTVEWISSSDKSYQISLSGELASYSLSSAAAGDTSKSFTLRTGIPNGDQYRVRVTDADGYFDYSDEVFTITGEGGGGETDGITVISPNGGETISQGDTFTVSWTDTDPRNTQIYLLKGGTTYKTIDLAATGTTSYSWIVDSSLPDGNDYQIKLTNIANAYSDISDGYFTIGSGGIIPGGMNTVLIILAIAIIGIVVVAVLVTVTKRQ